uniref:AlNc14C173G8050 protein n=1 Tax=Albugo laibachii Nc14 TaxID=890382 RepID=F0WNM9_9STRA|nr:AlNc14C173G8050 [Albugo laibachii Nc14]|eukprot:CCA22920.1 AlNc14C173G8050 [Albugo laibachii Nc14]
MTKTTGRRRLSGEGRREKKCNEIPDIIDTITLFLSITDDGGRGSKRKVMLNWKLQCATLGNMLGRQQLCPSPHS